MANRDLEVIEGAFPEQCQGCTLQVGCVELLATNRDSALRRAQAFGNLATQGECEGVPDEPRERDHDYIIGADCSFRRDMAVTLYLDPTLDFGLPGDDHS